jgi:predicted enzyme related to lactoylglutathione lyase
VKSVTETCAKVADLGGKVVVPPAPELFKNHVAVVADPTGAGVGLLEWNEELLKGDK